MKKNLNLWDDVNSVVLSRRNEFLRRQHKIFFQKNSKVVVVETHYDDLKCLVRRENLTQAMQEI